VADTGTGIDAQDVQRVFNPLFTTRSGGMGMGLAICRSIIEAHGGMLWVAPNAPRGSTFQVDLGADAASSVGIMGYVPGSGVAEERAATASHR
ncbi:MAG TPA: ATP-binding protein, partial [Geminicoccaceae bacterium]|nr:ATP-binding protein [Geminicoccaceae bacterium]